MEVNNLSKSEIKKHIAQSDIVNKRDNSVRMLFVPNQIDEQNFDEICRTYNTVREDSFDTIIVVESYVGTLNKKLAMPSNKSFETRFGEVPVNDFLRNEFCDEEDDFFIYDEGYSKEMSLFEQLPILQSLFDEFNVLSLQIGDYDPAIVRELAFTLDELLRNKNALMIFCCDIPGSKPEEIERLREMVIKNNESGLMHYLNSSDKQVRGARAFMSGILVARSWNLEVELLDQLNNLTNICGFAYVGQPQLV